MSFVDAVFFALMCKLPFMRIWVCTNPTSFIEAKRYLIPSKLLLTTNSLVCISGLAAWISGPLWNNKYWIPKIVLFVGLFFAAFFITNSVFDDVYIWIARIGAFIFSILMQIVLIDVAYTYNDRLVNMADKAGADTEGKKFLFFLVGISLFLLAAALACLIVLFYFFHGCTANNAILSLTLLLCTMAVVLQLSGDEGNLLTSSVVVLYAVFMAYSAVSKNPQR